MSTYRNSDRRSLGAGVGAAAYFLLTGVIFATWASRVPAIKDDLGLGDGQFALAPLGLEAGAALGHTKNYSAAWCGSQCGARVLSRRYRRRHGSLPSG